MAETETKIDTTQPMEVEKKVEKPEEKADEMRSKFKVKATLFYGTPRPNPSSFASNIYLRKEDVETEIGDRQLFELINYLIVS